MFAVSFKLKDGGRHHREFDITEYTVSSFETVYMASDARFVYYKYCAYIGYALCYDSVLRLQRRGPHLSLYGEMDISHAMGLVEKLSGWRKCRPGTMASGLAPTAWSSWRLKLDDTREMYDIFIIKLPKKPKICIKVLTFIAKCGSIIVCPSRIGKIQDQRHAH